MTWLRTKFLNTTAVLLDKPNEGAEDARSAAQKERDSIEVESTTTDEENVEGEENGDNESDEDDDSDESDDEDEKEETDDEKAARIAQEKEARTQARIQKRIDKLTASNKNYEAEIAKLQKALEAKKLEGMTEEDIDRIAEEKAIKKVKELETINAQKAFERTINKLEKEATKIDPKFGDKVSVMVEEIGSPIPATLMNVISDLDNENGGAVLNYLTDNIDEAEELYNMSERKMTQRLIRISDKLKENNSNKGKTEIKIVKRSKLPDPLKPLNEGNNDPTNKPASEKDDMDSFVKKREREREEYRKRTGGF